MFPGRNKAAPLIYPMLRFCTPFDEVRWPVNHYQSSRPAATLPQSILECKFHRHRAIFLIELGVRADSIGVDAVINIYSHLYSVSAVVF